YKAVIFASRDGEQIPGNEKSFTVEEKIDKEFYVSELKVEEDVAAEKINELEDGGTVKNLLVYLQQFFPEFDADDYIAYQQEAQRVYVITGKIEGDENAVVYLISKSVILGSAVISDASQKGTFKTIVSKELPKDLHTLNAYAYNPKKNFSTNPKKISFNTK
ncbi:MAG: hypothetical protein WCX95_02625, partial [Candidatus Gracilibacteria bacterium]